MEIKQSVIDSMILMAEKNDLESLRKVFQENLCGLTDNDYSAWFLSMKFFLPYEMAYNLGNKEFCLTLINELEKYIGEDCSYLFFDEACN